MSLHRPNTRKAPHPRPMTTLYACPFRCQGGPFGYAQGGPGRKGGPQAGQGGSMKARDHEKIMRQQREQLFAEMKKRQQEDLVRMHDYFDWEIAYRERIMDNYANALGRQDEQIAILKQMLVRLGLDSETIERRLDEELSKLNVVTP